MRTHDNAASSVCDFITTIAEEWLCLLLERDMLGNILTMSNPKRSIIAYVQGAQLAMSRRELSTLMDQAENLMSWHQAEDDDEKVQAASQLDEIAQYLMKVKEFSLARSVIIGSLRVKGTLENQSGLTTFGYELLEECERASSKAGTELVDPVKAPWFASSKAMILLALAAVASAWTVFMLIVR